jgi:hypothetical protein
LIAKCIRTIENNTKKHREDANTNYRAVLTDWTLHTGSSIPHQHGDHEKLRQSADGSDRSLRRMPERDTASNPLGNKPQSIARHDASIESDVIDEIAKQSQESHEA